MKVSNEQTPKVRLDKWLWAARFFKTRSLAKAAIDGGKVHLDGQRVKVSKEISEGDILCFQNAGAYCFSMASNYNSRYRPAEVMIYEKNDYLIRKRETFEDLIKNQEIIEF